MPVCPTLCRNRVSTATLRRLGHAVLQLEQLEALNLSVAGNPIGDRSRKHPPFCWWWSLSPGLQALCYGVFRHPRLQQLTLDASQCQLSPFSATVLRRASRLSPGCLRSFTLNLSGNSFMADASWSTLGGLVSSQTVVQ